MFNFNLGFTFVCYWAQSPFNLDPSPKPIIQTDLKPIIRFQQQPRPSCRAKLSSPAARSSSQTQRPVGLLISQHMHACQVFSHASPRTKTRHASSPVHKFPAAVPYACTLPQKPVQASRPAFGALKPPIPRCQQRTSSLCMAS